MTTRYGPGRHRRTPEAWQAMNRELANLGAALAEQQGRLIAAADLITDLMAERDALREAAGPLPQAPEPDHERPRTLLEQFRQGVRAARQAL